jgi:glucodextranase-like protein/PASTA domain-containing protein
MRRPVVVFACLAAAAVTGCGSDDGQKRAQRPPTPVALKISSPADMTTVRTETVRVTGTVDPAGAAVLVLGQKAPVSGGGRFAATVPLEPGANVIDIMATAGGRGPALTAFRVTREMPVTVPDLGGKTVDDVNRALGDLGLQPEVEKGGGLIEDLLPGDPAVCEQDPDPGTQVRRGTKVHVVVSKSC